MQIMVQRQRGNLALFSSAGCRQSGLHGSRRQSRPSSDVCLGETAGAHLNGEEPVVGVRAIDGFSTPNNNPLTDVLYGRFIEPASFPAFMSQGCGGSGNFAEIELESFF
jgi:hypothetical protein